MAGSLVRFQFLERANLVEQLSRDLDSIKSRTEPQLKLVNKNQILKIVRRVGIGNPRIQGV